MSDEHDGHDFDPAAWMADANCRGMDTNLFYAGKGESTREAKAVCRACDVWGGLSCKQRRRLRRGLPVSNRGPGRPSLRVVS